ncbi:MAG: YkgJ family cysteine cluster protein [candidate division Zixibacteria bacterium]
MDNTAKMKIGDPLDLREIDGFEEAYKQRCGDNNINHVKFLGPDDTFSFACKKLNTCCRDFSYADRINLDPYDIYRLSRKKKLSTTKFIEKYAELMLDKDNCIPIATLTCQGTEGRNKCHFSRSYGCSVYNDRPLRCRLYPLGKISNKEKSYFMLINNCPCGDMVCDTEWTVNSWLSESECDPYIEYQQFMTELLEDCDLEKYKSLSGIAKIEFGKTIYDLDSFAAKLPTELAPKNEQELMMRLSEWVREFMLAHGCLKAAPEKIAVSA